MIFKAEPNPALKVTKSTLCISFPLNVSKSPGQRSVVLVLVLILRASGCLLLHFDGRIAPSMEWSPGEVLSLPAVCLDWAYTNHTVEHKEKQAERSELT